MGVKKNIGYNFCGGGICVCIHTKIPAPVHLIDCRDRIYATRLLLPVGVPQTGTSVHGWQASRTGKGSLLLLSPSPFHVENPVGGGGEGFILKGFTLKER